MDQGDQSLIDQTVIQPLAIVARQMVYLAYGHASGTYCTFSLGQGCMPLLLAKSNHFSKL